MPASSFPTKSILTVNQTLTQDQSRSSPNSKYRLIFQMDGNLVLYAQSNFPSWAANTHAIGAGGRAELLANGDLVVFDSKGVVAWASSHTAGWRAASGPGSFLLVTDDNKLVVYAPDDSVLWSAVGKPVPKKWVSEPID
jgi:hypothetical protein